MKPMKLVIEINSPGGWLFDACSPEKIKRLILSYVQNLGYLDTKIDVAFVEEEED